MCRSSYPRFFFCSFTGIIFFLVFVPFVAFLYFTLPLLSPFFGNTFHLQKWKISQICTHTCNFRRIHLTKPHHNNTTHYNNMLHIWNAYDPNTNSTHNLQTSDKKVSAFVLILIYRRTKSAYMCVRVCMCWSVFRKTKRNENYLVSFDDYYMFAKVSGIYSALAQCVCWRRILLGNCFISSFVYA